MGETPFKRAIQSIAAFGAAMAATLFIVVSFWKGFRIEFPVFTLAVTQPLYALGAALLFATLHSLCAPHSDDHTNTAPLPAHGSAAVSHNGLALKIILFVAALLMIRFMYRAYLPVLRGGALNLGLLALIPPVLGASSYGAWRIYHHVNKTGFSDQALLPAIFWAISPLAFPVHPLTLLLYVVNARLIPTTASPAKFVYPARLKHWLAIGLLVVVLIVYLGSVGPGWAFGRARNVMLDRLFPGIWLLWLCGMLGTLAVDRTSVLRPALARTGAWAFIGLAVSATRGIWSITGPLWALPLTALLIAQGLIFFDQYAGSARHLCLRNTLRLLLIGLLFGFVGHNILKDIRPPPPPEKPSSAAPRSPSSEPVVRSTAIKGEWHHGFA